MTIDLDTVRHVAQSIATADVHNDDVDDGSCHYTTHTGTPGCIVGAVLSIVGLPRPSYGTVENGASFGDLCYGHTFLDGPKHVHADGRSFLVERIGPLPEYAQLAPDAVAWLCAAQGRADGGYSWGEAVAYADRAED